MARKSGSGGLSGLPIAVLQAELRRRSRSVSSLAKRREKLIAKLNELDALIRASGGTLSGTGAVGVRKRPKNDTNLEEALARMLKGKTMSVTEASIEVQKSGYRTSAENFRTIVNQCLIRSKKFKKVSRGQYTAA